MSLYRWGRKDELKKGSRAVVLWNKGVVFRCPCDYRQVYVASPPHTIKFDPITRKLTLDGSCGYRANQAANRPQNWCHFSISDGAFVMHGDSQCPGKDLKQ